MFKTEDLTEDLFLGGRLRVKQPKNGYRAGVDPVFLAAGIDATAGQSVLELGLGAGTASLCLGARVSGLTLCGIEMQADYAALARTNAEANEIDLEVIQGDISEMPADLRARSFDHVIMNPPYYLPYAGSAPKDPGRGAALREALPLADWIEAGGRRLKPKGLLTVIQRADRLATLILACERIGSLVVQPLAPRDGRDATLVLVSVRKGGRAAFQLRAPIILHEGARHKVDGENYRPEIQSVLRKGAALAIG